MRLLLVLLLLACSAPAVAGPLKLGELRLPPVELPDHDGISVAPVEGWEAERVQNALLAALADGKRGLGSKRVPTGTIAPSPGSRPAAVVATSGAPDGVLVLEIEAREPKAIDKVRHKRVNYDHRFQVVRKTSAQLDFRLLDPRTGAVVHAGSVTAKAKTHTTPWNTDEDVAVGSAPPAGTMCLPLIDRLVMEIVDDVVAQWQFRAYAFQKSEFGQEAIDRYVMVGRLEEGVAQLQTVVEAHPDSEADLMNLALALSAMKAFDEALELADRAVAVEGSKAAEKLAAKIVKWREEHARLLSYGYRF